MMWAVIILGVAALWFWTTQPLFGRQAAFEQGPSVDPERLEAHVRALAEEMVPRDSGHPENLRRAAEYIRREFDRTKGEVTGIDYQIGGREYSIVSLLLGPQTQERIVIGAHYDSPPGSPGADDNASGVAGLVELAHALSSARLPMAVELVAYPVEEPPFYRTQAMGSFVHASSLRRRGVRVRLMVCLEMIGYFNDGPFTQSYPFPLFRLTYPWRANYIAVVARLREGRITRRFKRAMRAACSVPVFSFNGPSLVPGVDLSDHLNYWKMGFRAVMVTDTSFYRYDHYHGPGDVAANLDYGRMAEVVRGLYGAVLDTAKR
ncbi:MAG: M28 family peptidase [bacterium]|nr:MAG: M28 family peptidase [bacterium]